MSIPNIPTLKNSFFAYWFQRFCDIDMKLILQKREERRDILTCLIPGLFFLMENVQVMSEAEKKL